MVTLADMQAATPKCPQPQWRYGPKGREEELCGRPLRWHDPTAMWVCGQHGPTLSGAKLAEQNTADPGRLVFVGEE